MPISQFRYPIYSQTKRCVYCRFSSSNYCNNVNAPVLAASAGEPKLKLKQTGAEKSSAERLRLGSLAEDGLSYKEKFVVRCYEVGINKTATVETIANLFKRVMNDDEPRY